jgi:hypothetical protein
MAGPPKNRMPNEVQPCDILDGAHPSCREDPLIPEANSSGVRTLRNRRSDGNRFRNWCRQRNLAAKERTLTLSLRLEPRAVPAVTAIDITADYSGHAQPLNYK